MYYLRMKTNEGKYKEKDRRINEQFINGINDDEMMTEIILELPAVKKTSEITSEKVLVWARRIKVQETQIALMGTTKGNKEFDAIKG